jgi:hypothetical protein
MKKRGKLQEAKVILDGWRLKRRMKKLVSESYIGRREALTVCCYDLAVIWEHVDI